MEYTNYYREKNHSRKQRSIATMLSVCIVFSMLMTFVQPVQALENQALILSCGKQEHTHDTSCYNETGALVCSAEEHTHGEGCYTLVSLINDTGDTGTESTPAPEGEPTAQPSATPAAVPTAQPTAAPTAQPSATPTAVPTAQPTAAPTAQPSATPTAVPTAQPTAAPTATPTAEPNGEDVVDGSMVATFAAGDVFEEGNFTEIDPECTLTWKLVEDAESTEDETLYDLIISGTGPMPSVIGLGSAPWGSWTDEIYRIVLGEGVTTISMNAFSHFLGDYSKVVSLSLPSTLESIGLAAFNGSYMPLTESGLDLSNTKLETIPPLTFSMMSMTEVKFPATLTSVSGKAFYGCSELENVDFSASINLKELGGNYPEGVFSECTSIKTLELPDSVEKIHENALQGTAIETFTAPASLKEIGKGAFQRTALKSVDLSTAPGLVSIGEKAFYNNSSLSEVRFPRSIQSIGSSAFEGTKVTQIELPEGVKSIGDNAFAVSNARLATLESVVIAGTVESIGAGAFKNQEKVQIIMPDKSNLTSIGDEAFYGCKALDVFDMTGCSLERIGARAFYQCDNLSEIGTLNVAQLGEGAFYQCQKLTNLDLSASDRLEEISKEAFYDDVNLRQILLPSSLTAIGMDAFYNCKQVTELELPQNLQRLDERALYQMFSLKKLTLSLDQLTQVGANILNHGAEELEIHVRKSENGTLNLAANLLAGIDAADGTVQFEGGPYQVEFVPGEGAEEQVAVQPLNLLSGPAYITAEGVVYLLNEETLEAALAYLPATMTEYTVPETISSGDKTYSVTQVNSWAAAGAKALTSLEFAQPGKVSLSNYALADCQTLVSVNGHSQVEEAEKQFSSLGIVPFLNTGLEGNTSDIEIPGNVRRLSPGENISFTARELFDNNDEATVQLSMGARPTPNRVENNVLICGTGSVATLNFSISGAQVDNYIYRLYFIAPEGDLNLSRLGMELDTEYTYTDSSGNGTIRYKMTLDNAEERRYCVEFVPDTPGITYAPIFRFQYQAPETDGGHVIAWVEMYQKDDSEKTFRYGNYFEMLWEVERTPYSLTTQLDRTENELQRAGVGQPANLVYDVTGTVRLSKQPRSVYNGYSYLARDNALTAQYKVSVTMPEEMTWLKSILDDCKAGNVTVRGNSFYAGETEIIAFNSNYVVPNRLEVEGENLIFYLSQRAAEGENDLPSTAVSETPVKFLIPKENFDTTTEYNAEIDQEMRINVETQISYAYSEPATLTSNDAIITIKPGDARVKVTKHPVSTLVPYRGNDYYLYIDVTNDGMRPGAITKLDDEMTGSQTRLFFDGEEIEQLFFATEWQESPCNNKEYNQYLTLTIDKVRLYDKMNLGTVTAVDGTTQVTLTALATDELPEDKTKQPGSTDDHTVVIQSQGEQLAVSLDEGEPKLVAQGNLQNYLDEIGFAVVNETVYKVNWDFTSYPGGALPVRSGEMIRMLIPTELRDSFQSLKSDTLGFFNRQEGDYPPEAYIRYDRTEDDENTARLFVEGSSNPLTSGKYFGFRNDYYIYKEQFLDGVPIGEVSEIPDESVFDYKVWVGSNADGTGMKNWGVDGLPIVDVMSGVQAMLVPVKLNQDRPWAKDPNRPMNTYEVDGVEYFVMDLREGEESFKYDGVFVSSTPWQDSNGQDHCYTYADNVTVYLDNDVPNPEKYILSDGEAEFAGQEFALPDGDNMVVSGGYATITQWYLDSSLFESEEDLQEFTISYKALTSVEFAVEEPEAFEVLWMNNVVYLNDRDNDRLWYPTGWFPLVGMTMDKKILLEDGSIEEDDETVVREGETVHYRLRLLNSVKGTDGIAPGGMVYDVLPDTCGLFQWDKTNVNLRYEYKCYPEDSGVELPESAVFDWDIVYDKPTGKYRIVWRDDIKAPGGTQLVMYVDLVFPDNTVKTEDGRGLYEEYCLKNGGARLSNSFVVGDKDDMVYHYLAEPVNAVIQKGVYSIETIQWNQRQQQYMVANRFDTCMTYPALEDNQRYVTYYLMVYNDGNLPLYLTEVYDHVQGDNVEFKGIISGPDWTRITIPSFGNPKPALLTKEQSDTTGQEIILAGKPLDSYELQKVEVNAESYEDETGDGWWYRFTFEHPEVHDNWTINYDENLDMCYLDPGAGICLVYTCRLNNQYDPSLLDEEVHNTVAMPFYDQSGAGVVASSQNVTTTRRWGPANDGDCKVWTADQAAQNGFTSTKYSDSQQWVASEVTIQQGDILPGITKQATKVRDQNGYEKECGGVANSSDDIQWKITGTNSDVTSIRGYTLVDTLPAPYTFTGQVDLTIYNSSGNTGAAENVKLETPLFEITGYTREDQNDPASKVSSVTVQPLFVEGADPVTISVGEAPVVVGTNNEKEAQLLVGFGYDGENMTMTLTFPMTYSKGMTGINPLGTIPGFGRAEITLWSENTSNQIRYSTFINDAVISPQQEFDPSSVVDGTCVYNPDGSLRGIQARAAVTVSDGIFTSSLKGVAEIGDEENKTDSSQAVRYIVLGEGENTDQRSIRYTLQIGNSSPDQQAIQWINLIDNLPQVGDHLTFNPDMERYSDFQVNFKTNPNVTVWYETETGEKVPLSQGTDYTVQFNSKTEFTPEDWKGTSPWSDTAVQDDSRSIRLCIGHKAGQEAIVPQRANLFVTFECEIAAGETPAAGEIAWNSFGYHYKPLSSNLELESAPLEVGVMIPETPRLQKVVVDADGTETAVEQEQTFRFLVYTGEALEDQSPADEAAFAQALQADGRQFTYLETTVKAGESRSATRKLNDLHQYGYENGSWVAHTTPWTWIKGQPYTIVELGDYKDYDFYRLNDATTNSYTFVHNSATSLLLQCTNKIVERELLVTKVDNEDPSLKLQGAVFALYSIEQRDQMTQEEYQDDTIIQSLKQDEKPDMTQQVGSQTYYLYDVAASNALGQIQWDGLLRGRYYLMELRPAEGYQMEGFDPQEVIFDNEQEDVYQRRIEIRAQNQRTYAIIPKTGGGGTIPFTAAGLGLTAGAAVLLLMQGRRCKKRKT